MDYKILQATTADAALIAHQRALMFNEHQRYPASQLAEMESRYAEWVVGKIATEHYMGWFARSADGTILGGAGLWLREWPPILNDYTGRKGYIENVYTVPAYRQKGIAHHLMVTLLNWARASGTVFNIALHATSMAQPLYQTVGFKSDNGLMSLWIGPKKTDQ